MEFLLQWLDELDDFAASLLFVWHRAGVAWLAVGLLAATMLHFEGNGPGIDLPAAFLAGSAVGSVVIWGVGGLLAAAFQRRIGVTA